MTSEHIFGCWEWDAEENCIFNSVTRERLRYLGQALPNASPWQGRFYALQYEANDFTVPVVISAHQALRSNRRSALFWRKVDSGVELVTLYQLDFNVLARVTGDGSPTPFGVWQRLMEFVPEAILFWPRAWENIPDPANGPGCDRGARCIRTIGAWANGSWRSEIGFDHLIAKPSKLDPTALYELLDREKWELADLASKPASPFHFTDNRTAEEAENDRSPWPENQEIQSWLAARGFAQTPEQNARNEVPSDPFGRVPYCRSSDDSRYFFLTNGIEARSIGHSPSLGPRYKLVAGTTVFSVNFRYLSQLYKPEVGNNGDKEITGTALYESDLKCTNVDEDNTSGYFVHSQSYDTSTRFTALTPKGQRLVRQNLLDAFAAWQPTQGIYPSIRERRAWEVEAEPGPTWVSTGGVKMWPFAWVELQMKRNLGGIYVQKGSPQTATYPWDVWMSYIMLDVDKYPML